MYTIGQVAKKFSLSRSALLYYDSKGVLSSSGRSISNYRQYSDEDIKLLERVMLFRSAGLSIDIIKRIVKEKQDKIQLALEQRLLRINNEMQELRNQQKIIVQIVGAEGDSRNSNMMNKETWVSMLKSAGLDENGMKKWHCEFEATSPEAHQEFLESIGIDDDEIRMIRKWSKMKSNKILNLTGAESTSSS